MARVVRGQIIATTGPDAYGDRIPPDVLRQFARQFDQSASGVAHDLSAPPVCRGFNPRIETLDNGELALIVDMEVLDEAAYTSFGGFSISFTRQGIRFGQEPIAVRVYVNPRQFDFPEVVRRVQQLRSN